MLRLNQDSCLGGWGLPDTHAIPRLPGKRGGSGCNHGGIRAGDSQDPDPAGTRAPVLPMTSLGEAPARGGPTDVSGFRSLTCLSTTPGPGQRPNTPAHVEGATTQASPRRRKRALRVMAAPAQDRPRGLRERRAHWAALHPREGGQTMPACPVTFNPSAISTHWHFHLSCLHLIPYNTHTHTHTHACTHTHAHTHAHTHTHTQCLEYGPTQVELLPGDRKWP